MENIIEKSFKLRAGKYLYKNWTVEKFDDEGFWLMFPPNEQGATDAANTLQDARAMIDNWT